MNEKTISFLIPCYNEEENIKDVYAALKEKAESSLAQYHYEIVFIDNKSTDRTREYIRDICAADKNVRAVFNCANFGQFNSPYYGILQCRGDCVILFSADFQDPVDCIPGMVSEWEKGHKVIAMVKKTSRENKLMYFIRSCYYRLLNMMSEAKVIEHFTGFGLYDRSFVEILRQLDDCSPFLRCIVAEYAPDHIEIPYEQQKRRAGKTHNDFNSLYDAAMLSFTNHTKTILRSFVFIGGALCLLCMIALIAILLFGIKSDTVFNTVYLLMFDGLFFVGGLFFIALGFTGEYIMNINRRTINRPLVIEEERINWD